MQKKEFFPDVETTTNLSQLQTRLQDSPVSPRVAHLNKNFCKAESHKVFLLDL